MTAGRSRSRPPAAASDAPTEEDEFASALRAARVSDDRRASLLLGDATPLAGRIAALSPATSAPGAAARGGGRAMHRQSMSPAQLRFSPGGGGGGANSGSEDDSNDSDSAAGDDGGGGEKATPLPDALAPFGERKFDAEGYAHRFFAEAAASDARVRERELLQLQARAGQITAVGVCVDTDIVGFFFFVLRFSSGVLVAAIVVGVCTFSLGSRAVRLLHSCRGGATKRIVHLLVLILCAPSPLRRVRPRCRPGDRRGSAPARGRL